MKVSAALLIFWAGTIQASAQFILQGELQTWHKITITFEGPNTSETADPNPFTDYRLDVTFRRDSQTFQVPGFYAADGQAAQSGASAGNAWRVHFSPHRAGNWTWTASFRTGPHVALSDRPDAGSPTAFDGLSGSFQVAPTDKTGRDHRGKGRLEYVGERYLRFAETGDYFLKIGADAPENFLAYEDFDNTPDNGNRRKNWAPHIQDWNTGDPSWKNNKGKGIIGAINYLAQEGQNAFSFLTMNIGGDDKNVFPYISDNREDRLRMDCSKLDQWEMVFEHADRLGLHLHVKTQETENDQLLDGGALGPERTLYYRELIARFAHHLALNWNLGEENTNTDAQRKAFADYFARMDPYGHPIVIHTYPGQDDAVYAPLLGDASALTGASLQVGWSGVHRRSLEWISKSRDAAKAWVVANDEQGNAQIGVPHDAYTGTPSQADIRKAVLWGNLLAGGAGVEYYFGYSLPHSDLTCQDFRSRSNMWSYNRHAHAFMTQWVPFWKMDNHNELIGNDNDGNQAFCLAEPGSTYVIYIADGQADPIDLDLQDYDRSFELRWYNPRTGGSLQTGSVPALEGPGLHSIGQPPAQPDQDWVALITVGPEGCPPAGTPCDDGDPATENDAEDGFCNCTGTDPNAQTAFWLEAECARVGGRWRIEADAAASGGYYLLPPQSTSLNTPPDGPDDLVRFELALDEAGSYAVFARAATSGDGDDSFWVRANGGAWQKWNKINFGMYDGNFHWDRVGHWTGGDASDPVNFDLPTGQNTVEFAWREPGIRLDKILVTKTQPIPTATGPEMENCGPVTAVPAPAPASHQLILYPQPAREVLYIELNRSFYRKEEAVHLWDGLGRHLLSLPLPPQEQVRLQLPVGHLPPGLYVLQWRTERRVFLVNR